MKKKYMIVIEIFSVIVAAILYGVPLYFIIINSFKTRSEAADLSIALPKVMNAYQNFKEVIEMENGMVIRAFFNSTLITVLSIFVLVFVCAMSAFLLERRKSKLTKFLSYVFLAGLMIPPAIVPTIWVLREIHLFKSLTGMILVEVALAIPFTIIIYRGFISSIPREIDEAAIVDGCGTLKLFFHIIFPLLKPVTATVIVLSSISIFNDFANPLYFLPGAKNATIQLTLYNFTGMYSSSWNLLFADVVLISLPLLILFIFFNKQIVAGMTAGAVKG